MQFLNKIIENSKAGSKPAPPSAGNEPAFSSYYKSIEDYLELL